MVIAITGHIRWMQDAPKKQYEESGKRVERE